MKKVSVIYSVPLSVNLCWEYLLHSMPFIMKLSLELNWSEFKAVVFFFSCWQHRDEG